ncbi:DUF4190 domain-containing protein [Anatilimnocola floriformis]|uniref:DUF4190 domain-containing protein n=1 Tax=Anatilimnocola floriformis TaxID=2948575 RepID=UPI0020C2EFE2|nr:DUF4190 domain-containing protein [Anatilimnocola floriformis]
MSPIYGDEAEIAPYRALSRSAVVSVVLTVISLLGYLFEPMLVVAVAAFAMGLVALQSIRRYPLEYTGRELAMAGTLLSGVIFVTGATMHTYTYLTEVPDGYKRISFGELQPHTFNEPDKAIPSRALELSGEKVFVKGYTHKSFDSLGKVDHFILVPDLGECCFGDKVTKPTHMIEVKIVNPHEKVRYSLRRIRLMGKFVATEQPDDPFGVGLVYYHLEADKVK